jgi:single-strand DNA-binding protein
MLGGGSSGGGIANDNTQSSDKNDDMPQTSNDMDDEIPF